MATVRPACNASLPDTRAGSEGLARRLARQLGWRIAPDAVSALCREPADWLRWSHDPLSREDVETLAARWAIGETYFFRDADVFARIEQALQSALDAAGDARPLRLWSAGCSSGEEAYSLAIVAQRVLSTRPGRSVEIVATDIHPGLLQRAREGVYGDWSFRGVAPGWREAHLERRGDGAWAVPAALKQRVRFEHLNLADEHTPMPAGCDLVLCRHVLMYFEPAQARRTVERLRAALRPGGCLVVGPAEAQPGLFDGFEALREGDTVLWCRPVSDVAPRPARAAVVAGPSRRDVSLSQALARCERALAADKCDASLHFLHALLLEEAGRPALAREALRRVLFLDRHFVPAHLALGRLCDGEGRRELAQRHRGRARQALQDRSA